MNLLLNKLEVHLGVLLWTIMKELWVISVKGNPSILGNWNTKKFKYYNLYKN